MDAIPVICPLALQPQFIVLGLRLQPLTLAHVFILHDLGNPLILGGNASLDDLCLATFVCAQKPGNVTDFSKWWFRLFLVVWALRCRFCVKNELVERQQFQRYLDHWDTVPAISIFQSARGGVELATPVHIRLFVTLTSKLFLSPQFVMQLTLRRAYELSCGYREMEGTLQLQTKREAAFVEFAKQQDAIKAAALERSRN